jgi:hypothetical protein
MNWLNYQFWPRFSAGIGIGIGYTAIDPGDEILSEQYQGRINWQVLDKISVQLSGGVNCLQFLDSDAGSLVNQIYSLSVAYRPFEVTTLTLSANHGITPSFYEKELTENTTFRADLTQRVFKHFLLSVGGGYQTTTYISTTTGSAAGREDDYYTFSARLSTRVLKRVMLAALYTYNHNVSNQSGYDSSGQQVGFEIAYRY